jgi:hypothetical protein
LEIFSDFEWLQNEVLFVFAIFDFSDSSTTQIFIMLFKGKWEEEMAIQKLLNFSYVRLFYL